MAFTSKARYGGMKRYTDDGEISTVVESLIRELETEKFAEPDEEHCQIAIGYGDWAVTVMVSGLMVLDDMRERPNERLPSELFKRAASREEAAQLLTLMARGEVEAVRKVGWVPREQMPPWERDLFRQS